MKSWGIFAISPLMLLAAYLVAPKLPDMPKIIPVIVEQPDLSIGQIPPVVPIEQVRLDINDAVFGRLSDRRHVTPRAKPEILPDFMLQSILISDQGTYAVIDNKVVHKGSLLASGFRVMRIAANSVWISRSANGTLSKVLHFPLYENMNRGSPDPAIRPHTANEPVDKTELETKYRQLLEALPKI